LVIDTLERVHFIKLQKISSNLIYGKYIPNGLKKKIDMAGWIGRGFVDKLDISAEMIISAGMVYTLKNIQIVKS
jgi:hypothetical protein